MQSTAATKAREDANGLNEDSSDKCCGWANGYQECGRDGCEFPAERCNHAAGADTEGSRAE